MFVHRWNNFFHFIRTNVTETVAVFVIVSFKVSNLIFVLTFCSVPVICFIISPACAENVFVCRWGYLTATLSGAVSDFNAQNVANA